MVGVDIPEGDEGEPGKQHQISTRKFFGGQIWNAPGPGDMSSSCLIYMFCSADAGGILKFYSDDSPGLKVGPTTVRSSARSIFASDLQAMVKHGKTMVKQRSN
jgi:hypothetical protein